MPLSSLSPREEISMCELGFDRSMSTCKSRRGLPHLVAPAASSHTSGYQMDAPHACARGRVHTYVLRPAHPSAGPRPGLWPAEPYVAPRAPTPLGIAPRCALAERAKSETLPARRHPGMPCAFRRTPSVRRRWGGV
jgi:hypothetical protein